MGIYLVVIDKTSTGYSAHCPDVLGCAAVGTTVEEVVAHMKEALELHFEGMAEDGEAIPKPGGVASYRLVIKDLVASYRLVMKNLDLDRYLLAHVQIDTSRFAAPVSHS